LAVCRGRFRANGVSNVAWIWTPNVRYYGDQYSYSQIFPGDDYVDYVGLDGYNWGATQSWSVWQSFSEVFSRSYNELCSVSGKNVLIMETASAEAGGSKPDWITTMFSDLRTKFPRVQGFTWFSINKETDWRINSTEASKIAFSNAARGVSGSAPPNNTGNNSSSTSTNKKGSKKYQSAPNNPAVTLESADETTYETMAISLPEKPVTPPKSKQNASTGGFSQTLKEPFTGSNIFFTSIKLFCLVNALFLFLVLIVNRRVHKKYFTATNEF